MDLNVGFLIGRIRGVAIRIHWTWVLIFVLVAWNLQASVLPDLVPNLDRNMRWAVGFASAIAFFVSVLLHELAHAFVALHYGMRVPSITLFIFGGVSNIDGEMKTPKQEFRIAIAGPAMSLLLGFVLGAVSLLLPNGLARIVFYIALVNLILGIFNLVPGFPLDGGRVLRALVWAMSGDMVKATRVASRVGTGVAWLMIAGGVFVSLYSRSLIGLWYVLIGLFLKTASESAYGTLLLERALAGVKVRDVMRPAPEPVAPEANLGRVVEDRVIGRGERAVFVGSADRVLGLFTVSDLAKAGSERFPSMTAREVMVPAESIIIVAPDAALLDATRAMTARDIHQLPVVEDGRMVGLLTRGDVLQQLEVRKDFREIIGR